MTAIYSIWEEHDLEPTMKNKNSTESGECGIIGNMLMKKEKKALNGITKRNIIGVYKIVNKVNGKYYIGSSNNILKRWTRHRNDLDSNKHRNVHLQRAWNKYGKHNFEFSIIEMCEETQLLVLEKQHIGDNINPSKIYNLEVDPLRPSHSEETRLKMSKSLLGHGCSKETRIKMGMSRSGNKNINYKSISYNFLHLLSGDTFQGTMYDWRIKFNIPISNACMLTNKQLKTSYGWKLIE